MDNPPSSLDPALEKLASPIRRDDGVVGVGHEPREPTSQRGPLEVICGPLINYKHTSDPYSSNPTWHGTILIVSPLAQDAPRLRLKCLGAVRQHPETEKEGRPSAVDNKQGATAHRDFASERLYQDPKSTFWRFSIGVPIQEAESQWEYHIPGAYQRGGERHVKGLTRTFVVPSVHESMRILFHSCNGFEHESEEVEWNGCALWNDVLRRHAEKPFHVMIGGGDQIYNDGVRDGDGPLRPWTNIKNPKKRRDYKFPTTLRDKCDEFYFGNYVRWYSTEPFASANAQIPQINIWDDHDIIDGYGSYTGRFMRCDVFRGLGGVAFKYYMLFQHHVPPPLSTYTTDAPQTMDVEVTAGPDPVQLSETFVAIETKEDPSYLFGRKPGPYIQERSRSVFCHLGANIAFLGIDARTERTRHQINYPNTYDHLFQHVSQQLSESSGRIKHLILLLGVPIAYPRLEWLESVFRSPVIAPIKLLNKRFGWGGAFFNQFDGSVELLDDLDDHYATHAHKGERKDLVQRLQKLAKAHSVRVTILGGDVHLAAFGRFYSNPKLGLRPEHDWRYMPNVISSAITNHPPPAAIANFLARRNRIHHLDEETDETLLHLFDLDPHHPETPEKTHPKAAKSNYVTMPSRNYAIISASHTSSTSSSSTSQSTTSSASEVPATPIHPTGAPRDVLLPTAHHNLNRQSGRRADPREALTDGEKGSGAGHPAAKQGRNEGAGRWDLDVCYRVEVDREDKGGGTMGYGLSVPALEVRARGREGMKH